MPVLLSQRERYMCPDSRKSTIGDMARRPCRPLHVQLGLTREEHLVPAYVQRAAGSFCDASSGAAETMGDQSVPRSYDIFRGRTG